MNFDEIEAEAMQLDPAARSELARRLAATVESAAPDSAQSMAPSLATPPTPPAPAEPTPPTPEPPKVPTEDERERLWLQDAMRRSKELRAAHLPPAERGLSILPLLEGEDRDEKSAPSQRPSAKPRPRLAPPRRPTPKRPQPARSKKAKASPSRRAMPVRPSKRAKSVRPARKASRKKPRSRH